MLLSVFSNVFKISVYKENTNLAIYWADRVYDGGNLSFCNNSFLENANSLVFICGIDVWNVDVFTSTNKLVSSVRVVNSVLKKR